MMLLFFFNVLLRKALIVCAWVDSTSTLDYKVLEAWSILLPPMACLF